MLAVAVALIIPLEQTQVVPVVLVVVAAVAGLAQAI
jgi:hypothetical protein